MWGTAVLFYFINENESQKENKTLFPTDVGEVVSDFLEKHFMNYISDSFTAEMEDELDEALASLEI